MYKFNKFDKEEFKVAISNVAMQMNINNATIEKDYWVCYILNYLFNECVYQDAFKFKGGTSLSKCFGVINRFSEDVDLILDWRVLGYSKDEPFEERSNTKQDKFNKHSNEITKKFLNDKLLTIMRSDLEERLGRNFLLKIDENDKQTILFEYPVSFDSQYLVQSVKLEIGMLADWTPSEEVGIKPYIANYYPKLFEGDEIILKTVSPEQTFWEKATILHHEANRPEHLEMPSRYARHYYDMYALSKSVYKKKAFSSLDLLEKVAKFKNKFYPRKWARYEEATKDKLRLMPDDYRLEAIRKDYENMSEMFFGDYPSFEELITTIKQLEEEIRQI